MAEEKNKGGRPTKMTKKLIDALIKVLEDKDIIVLTDEELIMFMNEELEENEQIHMSTFEKWKGNKLPENKGDKKIIQKFLRVIKKALYTERSNLMKQLKKDSQWQRYAWILERKFTEWNLKHISEGGPPLVQLINLTPEQIKEISDTLDEEI